MAIVKKFGLAGIGNNVQLGKAGPRIKINSNVVEIRNAADSTLSILRVADAVGDSDAITKSQLTSAISGLASGLEYKGTFDASAGSWNALEISNKGDFYKVSVAGTIGTIEMAVNDMIIVNKIVSGVPVDADIDKIDNTEAADILRTGDISNDADFSADGTKIADRTTIKAFVESQIGAGDRLVNLVFGTSSPLNIGEVAPAGTKAKRAYVTVTTAFDGASESTLSIGVDGDIDSIASVSDIDLHTVGEYEIVCNELFSSDTQIIATYTADSASAGAAEIVVELVK